MPGVWIWAEEAEQARELLAGARALAESLGGEVSVFATRAELARDFFEHGADEILLLPPLADDQPVAAYAPVIAEEVRRGEPELFLLAGTLQGKEIAAKVAARVGAGLCSDCLSVRLDPDVRLFEMQRLGYGGAAVQTIIARGKPQMATIPPRTFAPAQPIPGRSGRVRELPAPPTSPVRVRERRERRRQGKDVRDAATIVCVGRGFERSEDLELARRLAHALGGEIACTRPISEELHWLPEELCLGLSGLKVAPTLYVGVGVSGQVQHATGVRDSKVICAINRDEHAPIFDLADCGVVGDLRDVIPRLIEELSKA